MLFPTASIISFVQMAFIGVRSLLELLPITARLGGRLSRITGLRDVFVIVRIHSNPNYKPDGDCD